MIRDYAECPNCVAGKNAAGTEIHYYLAMRLVNTKDGALELIGYCYNCDSEFPVTYGN